MERVGEILKTLLDPETAKTAEMWHGFFCAWAALVGPDLAEVARLVEVERGEAVVQVEHPAASQLLSMRRDEVLARIRRDFPEVGVRGLRVQVRPAAGLADAPQAR